MWLVIAANSEQQYKVLCQKAERPELIEDERFKTNALRIENRKEMDRIIADIIASKTLDEWIETFNGNTAFEILTVSERCTNRY